MEQVPPTTTAERLDRLGEIIDPELIEQWKFIFERGVENLTIEDVGLLMRLAYINGYERSFGEATDKRGELYAQMGYTAPAV